MTRKKSAQTLTFTAIGVAFALVISALTYFAEAYPANFVLLGSGVVLLFVALILAQLRLWREGQAEGAAAAATRLAPINVRPAPPELKHGRFRGIWENLEETRRLMEIKEEKARQQERVQEKKRLSLPEEETILFMEERSWLSLWPVGLLSLICIASSAVVSETGVFSFVWLVLGLGGFLFIAAVKGRTTYYLTNFRILVRKKPLFERAPRWSAMPYPEVERYSCCQVLGGCKLTLIAKQGTSIVLEGLAHPHLEAIAKILLEKLPATAEGH